MPTHKELEDWIVGTVPSDAMSTMTLAPRPATPVHAVDAPCGVTTTHRVFHLPSKRLLVRDDDHPRGMSRDLTAEEDETPLSEAKVCGPPVEDGEVKAIREEARLSVFTARQTEGDRNAAHIADLRVDIQRDARDIARLESRIQKLRWRKEVVRELKQTMLNGADERSVDSIVGWKVPHNHKEIIVAGEWKRAAREVEETVKSDSGLGSVGEEGERDNDEQTQNACSLNPAL